MVYYQKQINFTQLREELSKMYDFTSLEQENKDLKTKL